MTGGILQEKPQTPASSGSDQDSDSRDYDWAGRDMRGMKRKRSGGRSASPAKTFTSKLINQMFIYTKTELMTVGTVEFYLLLIQNRYLFISSK